MCVCVCVCECVWYSLPKNLLLLCTHHYTEDKVVLSKLTLIHLGKFKSGRLPNIPTTIRLLWPLLSPSLRLPFYTAQETTLVSSCCWWTSQYFGVTPVLRIIHQAVLQLMIIPGFREPELTSSVCLFSPTVSKTKLVNTKQREEANLHIWESGIIKCLTSESWKVIFYSINHVSSKTRQSDAKMSHTWADNWKLIKSFCLCSIIFQLRHRCLVVQCDLLLFFVIWL